jgi:hypothetical protein
MDLRHNGNTLAVLVILFGTFTLFVFILRIWFRVTRRKYNGADTILIASVVSITALAWPSLAHSSTGLRHHPKHCLASHGILLRLRQTQERHTTFGFESTMGSKASLYEPNRLQIDHSSM